MEQDGSERPPPPDPPWKLQLRAPLTAPPGPSTTYLETAYQLINSLEEQGMPIQAASIRPGANRDVPDPSPRHPNRPDAILNRQCDSSIPAAARV